MKNVLVFTSIERAFYSSIIEYQLLEPIIEVSKKSSNRFIFTGFIPISFWLSKRTPWKTFVLYRANRRRVRQLLEKHGIHCSFVPTVFPVRNKDFYLRIPWLILHVLNGFPLLLCFLLRYRIDLIHARNYPAALLCLLIRYVLGIPYVFDMRDLYPEKGIEAGIFSKASWSYRIWKRMEVQLVRASSSVITTSVPFKEYVALELHARASELRMLPNCVNTRRFKPNEEKRKEMRMRYGLTDKLVLIHSGAFGTRQDLPIICSYFLKWKNLVEEKAHLVILCGTREYLPGIRTALASVGVSSQDYTLINPVFYDVPGLLLLGDIGLHLETMAIATPYCIAVKDGEYLASGLPIIVTPWLRGIAGLIQEYGAGIVVNPTVKECIDEKKLVDAYDTMRQNGFRLIRDRLSLDNSVRGFCDLYH